MRTYRSVWSRDDAFVTVPCVVLEAVTGGWARLALLVPTMLVFGGMLGFVFADDRPDRWTWARRGAGWLCVATAAADGLMATLGGTGALGQCRPGADLARRRRGDHQPVPRPDRATHRRAT